MSTMFPPNVGDFGGKTFDQIFVEQPKWVEFATTWTNATGLFEEFRKYVVARLSFATGRAEHEGRCKEYVKNRFIGDLPEYLLKYV